jgi:hypothetical protein
LFEGAFAMKKLEAMVGGGKEEGSKAVTNA